MSPSVPLVAEAGRGTLRALKRTARAVGITRGRAAAARMATERYALAVGGRTRVRPGGGSSATIPSASRATASTTSARPVSGGRSRRRSAPATGSCRPR
ncbi:hypothetical protein ACU4GR_26260 [Methylobacterium oryzae CBMB20]